jgi:membrane protein
VIEPTVDDVLSRGQAAVISIGFVLALWSGSRALNVFIDTTTIMYGMAGRRGIVRTRALSFVLYLVFLLAGIVLLPLILVGPTLVSRVLPPSLAFIGNLYWPVVLLGSVCMLATLYHLSVPARTRWRADLPGAAVSVAMWLAGSLLLRFVLSKSVGSTTIYGPLAAPIAFLIWLYVISIAVLIGAALNSSIDDIFPKLSGIDHNRVDDESTDRSARDRDRSDSDASDDRASDTEISDADASDTDMSDTNVSVTDGNPPATQNPLRRTLAAVRARRRVKSQ